MNFGLFHRKLEIVFILSVVFVLCNGSTTEAVSEVTVSPLEGILNLLQSNRSIPELLNILQSNPETLPQLLNILQSNGSLLELLNLLQTDGALPELLNLLQTDGALAELLNILQSNGSLSELLNLLQADGALPALLNLLQADGALPEFINLLQADGALLELFNLLQTNGALPELLNLLQADGALPELLNILQADGALPALLNLLQADGALPELLNILQADGALPALLNLLQADGALPELLNLLQGDGALPAFLNLLQADGTLQEVLNLLLPDGALPELLNLLLPDGVLADLLNGFQTNGAMQGILNILQTDGALQALPALLESLQPLLNQSIGDIVNDPAILATFLNSTTAGAVSAADIEELVSTGLALAESALGMYLTSYGVGSTCQSDVFEMMSGILSGQLWALQILDSYGKPERGIFQGDLHWMGNYQQCLDFYITPFNAYLDPVNPTNFEGKYCRVGLPLTQLLPPELQIIGDQAIIGSCVPESCLASDITSMFIAVQALVNVTEPLIPSVECIEDREVETSGFIVIFILVIIGFLILAATAYDVIVVQIRVGESSGDNEKPDLDKVPVIEDDFGDADVIDADDFAPRSIYTVEPTEQTGKSIHVHMTNLNGHEVGKSDVNSKKSGTSQDASFVDISEQKANGIKDIDGSPFEKKHNSLNYLSNRSPVLTGMYLPPKQEEPVVAKINNSTSTIEKIVLSFSAYTNGVKLLSTSQGAGSLEAINGIRFLSMCWVILGHTLYFAQGFSNNLESYAIMRSMGRWSFLVIINATYAVDTFFTLSGLLVAYLTLKEIKKVGGAKNLNWVMFYFHRFWRLTPAYMLVLMVGYVIYPLVIDGPNSRGGVVMGNCKEYWWANLLYVNNLVTDKVSDLCMGWSWYLSNDMQFYILSPLLLVPLFYNIYAGVVSCLVFLAVTVGLGAYITYTREFRAQSFSPFLPPRDEDEYFVDLYMPCYTRMGPYIIGAFAGYLLYRWKCQCKIHKALNLVLWVLSVAICCTIIYSLYNEWDSHIFTLSESTAYLALSRTGWGVAVSWIVFACATGNGGWINELLSWKPFVPLGRLSYCAYLIHPLVIYAYHEMAPQQFQFTDFTLSYAFVGHVVFSYGCAFIASLAFESPMMGIEKAIFRKK